ncbi:ABC-type Fe3+-hydroxamate transport system, periplasmic component [Methanolobus tindarius DSM 2278]|jgi:iron complex transport system substrate-binding protein|uniref:ABC-type Fe3+-hydroxamate transport system, periplasmic component n=1 Tax=Methanolobus tindarius DSM 2278 TaxID=1090322 RepID=W9DMM1_METTI|nr:iron ABC transporter substrate-binding protein [Methanolobus tindarius]ETA66829.1 ABC-type Fe3+-hydroxamate transport system, periplasmic component [Methanolobus tindarius DSM 2278]
MKGNKNHLMVFLFALAAVSILVSGCTETSTSQSIQTQDVTTVTITDALGREVEIPENTEYVICSGVNTLRFLTYLEAQDMIVGIDRAETTSTASNAKPYSLANPQFATDYVIFGETRGQDDPEKILSLDPLPDVIIKTSSAMGYDPVELQEKTGIPVVVINTGDLAENRDDLDQSLRIIAQVVDKEERAEEVIAFFDEELGYLNAQTEDIAEEEKPTCYVGGIGRSGGPQGFQSTEPTYPPFLFTNALNVAYGDTDINVADVSKEKIIEWDPDYLFLDLNTIECGEERSGLSLLTNDDSYSLLSAVETGNVYGVLPFNKYGTNFGSVIADSYFVGKTLYPDRFEDVDLESKTIDIYTFLVCEGDEEKGKEIYDSMINTYEIPAFTRLDI